MMMTRGNPRLLVVLALPVGLVLLSTGPVLAGQRPSGEPCSKAAECKSKTCTAGRCVPKSRAGAAGEYCNSPSQCASGSCAGQKCVGAPPAGGATGRATCKITKVAEAYHVALSRGYGFVCETRGKGKGLGAKHHFRHAVLPTKEGLRCIVPSVARGHFHLEGHYFSGRSLKDGWSISELEVTGDSKGWDRMVAGPGVHFRSRAVKKMREKFDMTLRSFTVIKGANARCGDQSKLIQQIF